MNDKNLGKCPKEVVLGAINRNYDTYPVSVKHQRLVTRHRDGSLTRAQAIKLKCLQCVGFENVSEAIGNCRAYLCPLWFHRPYAKSKKVKHCEMGSGD